MAEASAGERLSALWSRCAHDLRGPLAAIQGFTGLLAAGKAGPLNSRQQEFLDGSQFQQGVLRQRLEAFLLLAASLAGVRTVRMQRLELAPFLARFAETLQAPTPEAGLMLDPAAASARVVARADRELLQQALELSVPIAISGAGTKSRLQLTAGRDPAAQRAWIGLAVAGRPLEHAWPGGAGQTAGVDDAAPALAGGDFETLVAGHLLALQDGCLRIDAAGTDAVRLAIGLPLASA